MNNALYNLIRPHYRELKGYVSAGMETVKDTSKVFMNANENPFELPSLEGLSRYPQPQPTALLESYADLYDVSPDHIVMTRGADEAIVRRAIISRFSFWETDVPPNLYTLRFLDMLYSGARIKRNWFSRCCDVEFIVKRMNLTLPWKGKSIWAK